MDRIVLGFSGGVDSALTAELLREQGYEVCAVFLNTGSGEADSARLTAERMGLDFRVIDAREALEREVCRPFAAAYLRGETPNPCILCNPEVKLRLLCEAADELGASKIATGHYARTEAGALYMGCEPNDQSYMLCRIYKYQLERLLLPLGGYNKAEVREMAARRGIPSARKPDSMEICFIPDGDYAAWIERRGEKPPEGDIIFEGKRVARHGGIHRFTLGQRRGLGYAAGRRVYVSELRPDSAEVILSEGEALLAESARAMDMRWLTEPRTEPFNCKLRLRHSRHLHSATVYPKPNGELTINFDTPTRAPTPGQTAALYEANKLLGGAVIVRD